MQVEISDKDFDDGLTGIESNSKIIRGAILHYFSAFEIMVDGIIRHSLFVDEKEFDGYMELLSKDNFTMAVKQKLFIHCVEKYAKANSLTLTFIRENTPIAFKNRNACAHWIVDTSRNAVLYYKKTSKIKLIDIRKGKKCGEIIFGEDTSARESKRIFILRQAAIKIHRDITGH